jgi:hypothetical protein
MVAEVMVAKEEQAVEEQVAALYQLLEAFFSPLPAEVVGLLEQKRDWVITWNPQRRKLKVTTVDLPRKRIAFSPSAKVEIPSFSVVKVGETLGASNDRLYVNKERAFFQGKPGKDLKETLVLVRTLRPLFEALELSDLEEALEVLAESKGEEVRQHGPYVLAWSGKPEDPFLLRRGTIFGDFILDGAFLLGQEVTLQYPQVKVTLQGGVFSKVGLKLTRFELECPEWGPIRIQFLGHVTGHALDANPTAPLIREAVVLILEGERLEGGYLTQMTRELLRVLEEVKDPLGVLKGEDLLRQVGLRLLSRF